MPLLGPTVAGERPHFFKIILTNTKETEMLKVPTKFTKQHGDSLSNTLCLRVPNGGMWRVDVVKKDGEIWLQNGFKDFALHYSLAHGTLLVFRYNGNSSFSVLIFDKTASEIDYPIHNIQFQGEESHLEQICYRNDLPIEILDEWSIHATPQKRKRINSTTEAQNDANLLPSDSHIATTDNESNVLKFDKSRRKSDQSRQDLGVSTQEIGGNTTGHNQSHPKVRAKTRTLTPSDKARALLRSEAFQPKNPSFRVVMQPSYITGYRLIVPKEFVERFLTQKMGNITLSVSDARTWSVRYVWRPHNKRARISLQHGWTAFVDNNSLKVGDVCVFELINSRKSLLRVVVFRDTGDASCPLSLDNRSIADRVQKRRVEHKVEPSEISTDSLDDLTLRQKQQGADMKFLKSSITARMCPADLSKSSPRRELSLLSP